MEKIYRVKLNSKGMPNFATAVEIDTEISEYSDKLWRNAYERGKADRPQGEWIYIDEPIIGNPYGRYKCSECNLEEPFESDFCPNCGARMKGADDE
jgi:hypothetical protein